MNLEDFAYSKIDKLIRREFKTFSPSDKVSRVLGELDKSNHYEALVKESNKVGLVTIRDLLDVVQPDQTNIGEHPEDRWRVYRAVEPDYRVLDVVKILSDNRIRALPVLQEDEAVGFICQVELMEALDNVPDLANIPIKDLMKTPVVTMNVDDSIGEARRTMLQKEFSHLPILSNSKLVGMVTARDIVITFTKSLGQKTTGDRIGVRIARYEGSLSGIMDTQPLTATPDESVHEVVRKMTNRKMGACLVVYEGQVVGIITPRELLSPILGLWEEEELPVYIVGLPEVVDFVDRAVVENKIMRVAERALKIHPHISEISVRIKTDRKSGNRSRHEVNVNVYSMATEERFSIRKEGWDLVKVFDEINEPLDRALTESKHIPQPQSRRMKRIRFALREKPG
jgi:CBS domain-containing protein